MDIQVNPHEIYHRAKGQWLRTEAPKRDMQDLFFDLRILLLMLALDRVLNTAFFTVESTLFDQPDAILAFAQAVLMAVVTSLLLKQPVGSDPAP